MDAIKTLLDHDAARWIIGKIEHLEGRSKFCAHNAIRFLQWADEIFETSHPVASFCAMHATEEAVASFISAAKMHDHKDCAKKVNLHDHPSKALVSLLVQRLSRIAKEADLAIAVNSSESGLVLRIPIGGNFEYRELHLSIFRAHQNTGQDIDKHIPLGELPNLRELKAEVEKVADARNKLLYASDKGLPPGFIEPEKSLIRETQLSLGLIWAAIDLHMHHDQETPFVRNLLGQMAAFNATRKKKKSSSEQ